MQNIRTRLQTLHLKAFTLLESLTVLFLISFLTLTLSGSVQSTFRSVQETLFFLEFERMYKDSQTLSASSHQPVTLTVSKNGLSNGYQQVSAPSTVNVVEEQTLVFNQDGGNSSLAKIEFETSQETVVYQLYIGSGRYKKYQK